MHLPWARRRRVLCLEQTGGSRSAGRKPPRSSSPRSNPPTARSC